MQEKSIHAYRLVFHYLCVTSVCLLLCLYFYFVIVAHAYASVHALSLYIAAIIFLIVCLTNLYYGVCILVFFIPFQFKGVDVGYGVLSITDVMIIALSYVWLFKKIVQRLPILVPRSARFLILWFVFCIISFVINPVDIRNSIEYFMRILSSSMIFFILYDQIRTPHRVYAIMKTYIISALVVSAYGLWEFFILKKDLVLFADGVLNNYKRVETFMQQSNATATYLVFILPLILFFIMHARRNSMRLLYIAIGGAAIACLILTFSRAGWLSLIISLCFLPLRKGIKIISLLLIGLFLLSTIGISMLTMRERSIRRRAFRYRIAAEQFLNKPLFGYGLRTYKTLHTKYDIPDDVAERSSHSLYLSTIVETGICGFIAFIMFLLFSLGNIVIPLRKAQGRGKLYHLNWCLLASFCAFFIMKFFEGSAIQLSMWVMLALYNVFFVVFTERVNGTLTYVTEY